MKNQRKFGLRSLLLAPLLLLSLATTVSWFSDLKGNAPETSEKYSEAVKICSDPQSSEYYQSRLTEERRHLERSASDKAEQLTERMAYLELSVAVGACGDATLQYFYALQNETPSWMWSWHRLEGTISSCFLFFANANAHHVARYYNPPRAIAEGRLEPSTLEDLESATHAWMKSRPTWMWFAGNICP